ncbi:hypothetical protein GCM10023197_10620 [Gordonia humi]
MERRSADDVRLTPAIVTAWEARLGVERERMVEPCTAWPSTKPYEIYDGIVLSSSTDEPLRSVQYSRRLSMMSSFCVLVSPVRIERANVAGDADERDRLIVSVSGFRGDSVVAQNGRENRYGSGDLAVVSTQAPFVHTTSAIRDAAGLVIPFTALGRFRYLAERPRREMGGRTPLARAAAGFVRRFAIDSAVAGARVSSDAELAVIDLLAAALAELTLDGRYSLQDDRLFNRQAASDLIARRYRDPSFTTDMIAEELHMSRRHVYRLFEDFGSSPAELIAEARVEAGRKMLDENPWMQIGDIATASGFRSLATFRNQFKTRYGVSPLEYRERIAGPVRERC